MGVQTVVAIDCDPPASAPDIVDCGIRTDRDQPHIYIDHDGSTSVVLKFDTLAALIEWLDDLSDTATFELARQQRNSAEGLRTEGLVRTPGGVIAPAIPRIPFQRGGAS
jgi:hypothetical protein